MQVTFFWIVLGGIALRLVGSVVAMKATEWLTSRAAQLRAERQRLGELLFGALSDGGFFSTTSE